MMNLTEKLEKEELVKNFCSEVTDMERGQQAISMIGDYSNSSLDDVREELNAIWEWVWE